MTTAVTEHIPVSRWSKDHWSLLAYVETLCVDAVNGVVAISRQRVRCNPARHPMYGVSVGWMSSYGTRLKGFFDFAQRDDPVASEAAGLQLTAHDDWDCLDDLEAAGYVEIVSSVNGRVRLTDAGIAVASTLRAHKVRGGTFSSFALESMAAA